MAENANEQGQQGQQGRQYQRPSGVGVEVEVKLRNRLLMRTAEYTFERTDNQIYIMGERRGAAVAEALGKIDDMFRVEGEALDKIIAQIAEICRSNGVKIADTDRVFASTLTVLSPGGMDYIDLIIKSDKALALLHGMWIARIIDNEAFREQAHKLRSRVHAASGAVDDLFSRVVLGRGGNIATEAEEDDAEGEDESKPMTMMENEMKGVDREVA